MSYDITALSNKIAISNLRITRLQESIEHELSHTRQALRDRAFERKFIEEIHVHLEGLHPDIVDEVAKHIFQTYTHHQLTDIDYLTIFTSIRLVTKRENPVHDSLYHWMVQNCEYVHTYKAFINLINVEKKALDDPINHQSFEHLDIIRQEEQDTIDDTYMAPSKHRFSFRDLSLSIQWTFALVLVTLLLILLALFLPRTSQVEDVESYSAITVIQQQSQYDQLVEALVQTTRQTPKEFLYRQINYKAMSDYLHHKNSILLTEEYLITLTTTAKLNNINPHLLIAIIGQEQNFVNKDLANASTIIRNPYNLYGSWESYNESFVIATQITCNTIHQAFDDYDGSDPFIWLNNTYAEDSKWHEGVRYFFESFEPDANM